MNKTLKKLQEIGFTEGWEEIGTRVMRNNVVVSYVGEHTNIFAVYIRCPLCMKLEEKFCNPEELSQTIGDLLSNHECNHKSFVLELIEIIKDYVEEKKHERVLLFH